MTANNKLKHQKDGGQLLQEMHGMVRGKPD
jgi:hypothetical protein